MSLTKSNSRSSWLFEYFCTWLFNILKLFSNFERTYKLFLIINELKKSRLTSLTHICSKACLSLRISRREQRREPMRNSADASKDLFDVNKFFIFIPHSLAISSVGVFSVQCFVVEVKRDFLDSYSQFWGHKVAESSAVSHLQNRGLSNDAKGNSRLRQSLQQTSTQRPYVALSISNLSISIRFNCETTLELTTFVISETDTN